MSEKPLPLQEIALGREALTKTKVIFHLLYLFLQSQPKEKITDPDLGFLAINKSFPHKEALDREILISNRVIEELWLKLDEEELLVFFIKKFKPPSSESSLEIGTLPIATIDPYDEQPHLRTIVAAQFSTIPFVEKVRLLQQFSVEGKGLLTNEGPSVYTAEDGVKKIKKKVNSSLDRAIDLTSTTLFDLLEKANKNIDQDNQTGELKLIKSEYSPTALSQYQELMDKVYPILEEILKAIQEDNLNIGGTFEAILIKEEGCSTSHVKIEGIAHQLNGRRLEIFEYELDIKIDFIVKWLFNHCEALKTKTQKKKFWRLKTDDLRRKWLEEFCDSPSAIPLLFAQLVQDVLDQIKEVNDSKQTVDTSKLEMVGLKKLIINDLNQEYQTAFFKQTIGAFEHETYKTGEGNYSEVFELLSHTVDNPYHPLVIRMLLNLLTY